MPSSDASIRSGWRNPVLWLMLALPLGTVVAGLWTLKIAAGVSAVDSAPEPVKRTAQIQVSDLTADEAAARLALSAQLQWSPERLRVIAAGLTADEPVLQLDFVHPTESSLDRRVDLHADGQGGWRTQDNAVTTIDPAIAWHIRLSPPDGRWRLVGRLRPGQSVLALQPAIAAP